MQAYDRHAAWLGRPVYRRVINEVLARSLPPGATVLDVGTGPGRVPLQLAQQAPQLRIHGLDLSPEMIAFATQRASSAGVGDRVTFTTADVADLPVPDGSADLVVSTLSLHHWEDLAGGLREISRVLAPGGEAWIYDLRHVLLRTAPAIRETGVRGEVEPRLAGAWRINPLGRLVLRAPRSASPPA